jgi:RiboL-PSP-HEPN
MSRAASTFNVSIEDATVLLQHFDVVHKQSPDNSEVLKRAGLVMALTAWETYVEDCISECVQNRLRAVNGSPIGKFVSGKLEEELKRFHNPTSDKTRKLFHDYLEIDITESWKWLNVDASLAKKSLNELIAKRGDAVHRSKSLSNAGIKSPHLVKREELEKAIRFLKNLVDATESGIKEL